MSLLNTGLLNEFKTFAMRGNVVDMAVGVIIGTAFSKIVSSFVADVIMPPLGVLLGGVHFSNLTLTVQQAKEGQEEVLLNYGAFIQTVVDFLIIAGVIFVAIKILNALKRTQIVEEALSEPPPAPQDIQLLTEIRDLLKK